MGSPASDEHGCAVVAIRHLRKSSSDHATQRGLDSIDFSAAARSILLFAESPTDPGHYVIAHSKSSLGPRGRSIAVSLTGGDFLWEGSSALSADDLLRPPEKQKETPRDTAQDWLGHMLATGPVAVSELRHQAKEAGISWRTIERAKAELGIHANACPGLVMVSNTGECSRRRARTVRCPGGVGT